MSKAKHIATIVDSSGSITNNTLTTSLGLKAPLASPTLTGTPLTPTAAIGTNTTQIASTAYVRSAIADLVASAPSSLDTLNELATALGNDVNFSTTVTNSLALKAPLASPTFSGLVTGPNPSYYTSITSLGASSTSFNVPIVFVPNGGLSFTPLLHGSTRLEGQGYIGHVSFGCLRNGAADWIGGAYLGLGGNDNYTTEYYTFGLGGSIEHSSGVVGVGGTGAMKLPSGTTAQRPASPVVGMTRYNTTDNAVETYHGGTGQITGWSMLSNKFDATGGTVTTVGAYKYHTFTSSGTFNVISGTTTAEYLIVAGGGGGGGGRHCGGGGGGGFLSSTITLMVQSHNVVVGAGGAGGAVGGGDGVQGASSTIFGLTAVGGGRGGGHPNSVETGGSGGSGGGGGHIGGGGAGTSGQGYAGSAVLNRAACGAGGGANGIGGTGVGAETSSTGQGGNGGPGKLSTIDGNGNYYYAGGGGGSASPYAPSYLGAWVGGFGGIGGGGGGACSSNAGTAGSGGASARNSGSSGTRTETANACHGGNGGDNTGGGGGGAAGWASVGNGVGGNGGSGIVIIRYLA